MQSIEKFKHGKYLVAYVLKLHQTSKTASSKRSKWPFLNFFELNNA